MHSKEYYAACKKVAGYDARWPTDRFVIAAMEWLADRFGTIRIESEEYADPAKKRFWTVWSPEPDNKQRVCCGETIAEALISAVDSTEIAECV